MGLFLHGFRFQQAEGSWKPSWSLAHGAGAGFAPLPALLIPTPGIPAGPVGADVPEPAANPLRLGPGFTGAGGNLPRSLGGFIPQIPALA